MTLKLLENHGLDQHHIALDPCLKTWLLKDAPLVIPETLSTQKVQPILSWIWTPSLYIKWDAGSTKHDACEAKSCQTSASMEKETTLRTCNLFIDQSTIHYWDSYPKKFSEQNTLYNIKRRGQPSRFALTFLIPWFLANKELQIMKLWNLDFNTKSS